MRLRKLGFWISQMINQITKELTIGYLDAHTPWPCEPPVRPLRLRVLD
jgi:hypothetical protein